MSDAPSDKVPRSVLLARQEWAEALGQLQLIHRLGLSVRVHEAARLVHHLRALTGMLPEAAPSEAVVGWLHGTLETLCSTCPPDTPLANRALPLLDSIGAACEVLFERAGLAPTETRPARVPHSEPYPPPPVAAVTPRLPVLPPIRKLGRAAAPLVQKAAAAEEQDQPDESLLRDTDIDAQQALDELTSPGGVASAEAVLHKLKGGLYTARLNQAGFAVHTLESAVKEFRERENDPARLASFVAEAARRIASITTAALDGHTSEYEQLCRELRADAATLLGPAPLPPAPEPVPPPPETVNASSSLRSLALPYEELDELVHAVMRLSDEVSRLREMARPRPQEDDEIRGHLNGLHAVHRALSAKDRDGSFNLLPTPARERSDGTRPGFALLDLTRETPVNQLLVPMLEAVDSLQGASTAQTDRFFELFQTSERVDRLARSLRERVLSLRLDEFCTLLRLFERAVKDTARREHKQVRLVVEGGETNIDRRLLQSVRPALVQLLRNAVAHGIERHRPAGKPAEGTVTLRARADAPGRVVIEVQDDGAGINYAAIAERAEACGLPRPPTGWTEDSLREVLFSPGFSTREVADENAGRGQGMSVSARTIESAGGILRVSSEAGRGTIFRVELPAKLDYADLLFFACGDLPYAVRQVAVERYTDVRIPAAAWPKGSSALTQLRWPDGQSAPAILLPRALGLSDDPPDADWPAIELHTSAGSLYLAVSRLLDSQSAHIRPLDPILSVPPWTGAATSSEGRVVLLLDPTTLWESCRSGRLPPPPSAELPPAQRRRALVADDASSVRRALSDLLQSVGWEAELFTNGDTAWQAFQRAPERFDAVLTDLEMPHSNGYDLLGRIRALTPDKPVIVITSRAGRSHQNEARRLGATSYLVKPVDREALLPTLNSLRRHTPRIP